MEKNYKHRKILRYDWQIHHYIYPKMQYRMIQTSYISWSIGVYTLVLPESYTDFKDFRSFYVMLILRKLFVRRRILASVAIES